ncbi:cadmium-translocating P-type ATPase [Crassaminicella thermophila]|uniref:Cadmium-translocating P-type ATPase n=1 Tax=Crassaminicella thermophila TaxID=2599308 RepID=A0A5C0SBS7_CRATE|nr:heavy metal translocating P-type ATPase [Crassaminicella thermophila]QEK11621.1 cadmium-translocating P-type ATPase [Crassaminicella thermophila]
MNQLNRKEFILEGLDCANCAMKIESKINELNGVNKATVNFATQILLIEANEAYIDKIVSEAKSIVNKLEPHVIVKERVFNNSKIKKVYILEGLGCANCAKKIENKVNDIKGVDKAFIDFASSKLIIEVSDRKILDRILDEVTTIVKKLEPDVDVLEENKKDSNIKEQDIRERWYNKQSTRLIISAVLFGIAMLSKLSNSIEIILYAISYLLAGREVLLKAGKNIIRGQVFDENFLVVIATIGAFGINEAPEGVAVMLFFQVGEYLQGKAVDHSRKSIASLMDIRPDFANLKIGEKIQRVSPDEVEIGSIIVVKPGEKVPLDGKVIEGKSMVDTSALTGESVPRKVDIGDEVLGGFINTNGLLTVEVTKKFKESTVSKILDLVQNASSKKAPTENFITKFARYYTPIIVFMALAFAIIPPLIIEGASFSQWIYRALVFLVISCPCALVVSIPLGFFGGIGGASKSGVLVKGSNYLEALNNVDIVVFDKTGTLTKGVFKVTEIVAEGDVDKGELLEYTAYAESFSNHPIALSILKEYGKEVNQNEIADYEEISGHGIKVKVKGNEVLAGNKKLMNKENIECQNVETFGTVVHVAINKKYSGYIVISDEIKEDSAQAIKELKNIGVRKTVMLTGDNKVVGNNVGKQLGLDQVHAELLPHQKVEKLEVLDKEKSPKGKLIFVGDGINDAPVLARADVGVAMGGLGSDAAIEAADVVIMTDEPSKLVSGIRIAKRTRKIVWQNIIFALGVKAIVLTLGAFGIATLWEAVFADVGVTVLAVINAMRVMKVEKIK